MKYLVLSVDKFDFVDEKTKKQISGASIFCVNDYREDGPDGAGLKPTKFGIKEDLFKTFRTTELPAMFDIELTTRPGANSKPTLVVVAAKYVSSVKLFPKAV